MRILFTLFLPLYLSIQCKKINTEEARSLLLNNVHQDPIIPPSPEEQTIQKAYCCKNHLRCCHTNQDEEPPIEPPPPSPNSATTSYEIRAFLHDCPNPQCTNTSFQKIVHTKGCSTNTNKTTFHDNLTNCKQKLLLTIKVVNEGTVPSKSQYVILDHITEPGTGKKVNILNPYAIRIQQEPVMQLYPLTFLRLVNGEAKETVFNRHSRGYHGCDTSPENPTCGLVTHNGKMVPYSTGFCCSCDAKASEGHWPDVRENIASLPDDGGHDGDNKNRPRLDDHENDETGDDDANHYGFTGGDHGKMVYGRVLQKRADKSVNYQQFTNLKDAKSDARLFRTRRGGQSCDDIELPPSLHESTHCLTFSQLWYSMYQLEKPKILHRLQLQIFQKYEDCHGNTHWFDLTQSRTIDLSNENPTSSDPDIGIMASYDFGDDNCDDILDYQAKTLLIPEKRVSADQFMLIPNHIISHDGKKCDSVGVGYEAFYKQYKRCAKPPGSCLNNQPNRLFESDAQAEKEGRPGQFFLRNFARPTDEPLGYSSKGEIESLKLVYTKRHESKINMELNADLVTLMKPNIFATISEVYTDATNPDRTEIVVKVTNSGLLYGVYYVRLSGCPLSLPASLNNVASKSVLISAQHQHIFRLFLEYAMVIREFSCFVHVHNINQEMIASRLIRIRARDRCVCVWHCKCACLVADGGLKCAPLGLDEYHEAGFQGGMPVAAQLMETSYVDDAFALFFHMFIILMLTLLAMGLLKALLGLWSSAVGLWGLDLILGLGGAGSGRECRCDRGGISIPTQVCLNVIFFFVYPLALINQLMTNLCSTTFTNESSSECFCEEEDSEEYCGDENCSFKPGGVGAKRSSSSGGGESCCKCCSLIYSSSGEEKGE